jgi:hypothetical protein
MRANESGRPLATHPHNRKDIPMNDPTAKTTAEWPGILEAAQRVGALALQAPRRACLVRRYWPAARRLSQDRVGHDIGPVRGHLMAGAVDDDVTSLRAAPARPACRRVQRGTAGGSAGSLRTTTGISGKGLAAARISRRDASVTAGSSCSSSGRTLRMIRHPTRRAPVNRLSISSCPGSTRTSPRSGPAGGRPAAGPGCRPSWACQHASSCRQPGDHQCQIIDHAADGRQA